MFFFHRITPFQLKNRIILRTKIYTEEQYKELEEENKKLKEYNRRLKQGNNDLKEQNKKLKETIKDHQLYEEKLEHRIIELEELLH